MTDYIWGNQTQFFFNLTPDIVLDAVEQLGLSTTGRCLQLSSMENRVYDIELNTRIVETNSPSDFFVVVKFYRPGRWSIDQIQDEHNFLNDLNEGEIPVVCPLAFNGKTIFEIKDSQILYSLFPKKSGRCPDEFNEDLLKIMGRSLARLHNTGSMKVAPNRLEINPVTFGEQNLKFLIDNGFISENIRSRYQDLVNEICTISKPLFEGIKNIRIHGDCHKGNLILRNEELYFIDFDDMLMGPAIQDIWLIIPGVDEYAKKDMEIFLEAYELFREFDQKELKLIEPLRALRYIHFSAWMAKRWDDPIFKENFPYFNTDEYWYGQFSDLLEQLELIKSIPSGDPNGSFNDDYYY